MARQVVVVAAFAILCRKIASTLSRALSRAFARAFAHIPSFQPLDGRRRARFGSYLRCRCVPEAEASRWTLSHASAGAGRREAHACLSVSVCEGVRERREVCEGRRAELGSLGLLLTITWLHRAILRVRPSARLQGTSRGGDRRGDSDHTNGHLLPMSRTAFYDGVAHPHVFGHISPPFAFQKLRLSHKRGNALSYHLSSYFTPLVPTVC